MRHWILVADDDPYVRLHIAEILDEAGFYFDTAVDGNEALLILDDMEPDLLLLDLTMPRIDGWQVIREVRANPATRTLPIVVLSDTVSIPHVMSFGAQANVCKPIDAMALLDTLNEVLCKEAVSTDR
jgi:CheY-like chemotaxis protein